MKILFLLFQIAVSEPRSTQPHHHQRQVNSIKALPSTVQSLVAAFKSNSNEVPSSFLQSKNEKRSERWTKIINDNYRNTKKKIGTVKDMISWDTLTYTHDKTSMMDITILLNTIRAQDQSIDTSRVVMMFNANGDRLTMTDCRKMSDKEYDLHIINAIEEERRTELYSKYNDHLFDDRDTKVIPFRSKGQWGLISLDSQVVVPAQYDSISKPEFGYYHVISKKGHNLLDKDLKPVFDKPRKNIRAGKTSYDVLNDKGVHETFGAEENKAATPTDPRTKASKAQSNGKDIGERYTVAITSDSLKSFNAGKYVSKNDFVLVYDKRTRLFGAYYPNKNVLTQAIYRCVIPVANGRYFIVLNKNGTLGYLNSNAKELF